MKSIFTDSDIETLREEIQAYMKQMPDCDELAEYKREVEEVENDWAKLVDTGIFHDAIGKVVKKDCYGCCLVVEVETEY